MKNREGAKKSSKKMSILLWVLQIFLVLWNIWGGIFMIKNYQIIASVWALRVLPHPFWVVLGVLQLLFSLGLLLPGMFRMPQLTTISAACLVIISLLGIVLYDAYSGFPGILWAVIPAIVAAFVAYKR